MNDALYLATTWETASDSDPLEDIDALSTESFEIDHHPTEYRFGRLYSVLHRDEHPWPIDELERDRLEEQYNLLRELFQDRLFLAPIASPRSVLDIKTSTGCWAVECGKYSQLEPTDRHPSSIVSGVDLVRMQPEWVPPNCEFFIDNLRQPGWHIHYTDVELIHISRLHGDRHLLSLLLEGSYSCCLPGGWVEICDMSVQLDEPGENSAFHNFFRDVETAYARDGRQVDLPLHFETELTRHGFINVTEQSIQIPLWTESCDELTRRIIRNWAAGLEAYSFALMDKYLGKCYLDMILMCAFARGALQNGIKGVLQIQVAYGQKPRWN
ncbi:hypothetical protein BO94DRAFT_588094 [Aspergillus sclerotioniger CBS 115572]|uniref:S-adenosyl-L-methionine-dependent methyltransferase n=1 Tax=Aspergillus sclerotioniger CBS 115572 TaxID=1450535 RepID=A0A317W2L4_9EURO|nr:hypothetical protein BO94DRAFT_588094 [Aspergillus sclerotioniger CBS 115572]PWY79512.1 hypothetical protein BO94DRAFT_588094 [Aspergillus sclerotioniger CBS 115572]